MPTSLRSALLLAVVCLPFAVACSSDGPTGDRQPPTVSTTTPANGATGVARATTVTATFSEPIAPGSATTSSFTVTPAGGSAVAGTVTVSGATATFTPAGSLAFGTTYTARVTTGIEDVAGNALAAAHSWTFTTVANPAPTVVSVAPAQGATDVARNTTIVATFSEPVAAASVTTANFTVTPAGGAAVAGTIAVNGAVVTFTPTAQLAAGVVHTGRLAGITDLDGAPLAAPHTWTFTTANAAPTANAGVAQDVKRNATVTLAGSGSDPENETLTYRWTQVGPGPDVTGGAGFLTGASPTFTAPSSVSSVRFELRVTDPAGAQSQASIVQINIMEDNTRAIFVSPLGDDAAAGTRAAPMKTVVAAVQRAAAAGGGTDVYVANGSYDGTIELATGVSIYGGYQSATWVRDRDAYPTTITGSTADWVVRGVGATDVRLDGLRITTPIEAAAAGRSRYGVWLHNAADITITNNRITAGAGGPGTAGQVGTAGNPGLPGAAGSNAICTPTIQRGLGGVGGPVGAGSGASGFPGGSGGNGGASGSPPVAGRTGEGFAAGPGGQAGNLSNPHGVAGGTGSTGSDGTDGTGGGSFGTLTALGYLGSSGNPGFRANPGASGGGGGGAFAASGAGGGGGGGGASGGWGDGGTGGAGGGASIAVVVLNSVRVTIDDNALITGAGGTGGSGGTGGPGGVGALGGPGGSGCDGGGVGGPGGKGGNGGRGGHGGGGGGGPSIGILEDAASLVNLGGDNTWLIGAGGTGGGSQGASGASGVAAQTRKLP